MKSKWQLALACLVVGMTAFTGKIAYADMQSVSMYEEPTYCADWNFNDRNCSAYLTESSGKAAFGEPAEKSMLSETTLNACEDWSYNTPGCPAYLSRAEGKAAFGEATKPVFEPAAYCSDWNFNDQNCVESIRE
jgi:hypothetical protein